QGEPPLGPAAAPPAEAPVAIAVKANGYLDERGAFAGGWESGAAGAPPLATLVGVPTASLLSEGNVQLRITPREGYDLVADLSLYMNAQTETQAKLDIPAIGNLVVPAELYANLGFAS